MGSIMHDTQRSTLDEFLEYDKEKNIEQLAKLGINLLPDLSDEAQQRKYRQWEEDLKQGHKKLKRDKNQNG